VIGTIKAGFDTIASHLTVILLPLALDLLLWLGPRLSVKSAFLPALEYFRQFAEAARAPAADLDRVVGAYVEALDRFNLLSVLRTFPIGISSLLQGAQPANTPFGSPRLVDITSPEGVIGWAILLTLAGWLGGAVYFRWVASVCAAPGQKARLSSLGQSFTLSVLFAMLILAVGVPLLFLLFGLFAISPALGQGLFLVLGFMSMWLVVPLFFAGHGIFIYSQDMFSSIFSGLRMARFTLPNSSSFVFFTLILGVGLNYLWSIPQPNSWMLLVGILGHAFITTSLLAASFIYYREANTWLQIVTERLKTGAAPLQRN
jgi:hypothetical protein